MLMVQAVHKQIAHHFAKQGKMNILNAIPIITQKHSQHHIRAVTGLKGIEKNISIHHVLACEKPIYYNLQTKK